MFKEVAWKLQLIRLEKILLETKHASFNIDKVMQD